MYLVEFFTKTFKKSNVSVFIYLVLNYLVTLGIVMLIFDLDKNCNHTQVFMIGSALYVASMCIALSPIGEKILRIVSGCKRIQGEALRQRLYPLFEEAYRRAKIVDPNINPDVELFYVKDSGCNALATGRKTICITEGLMDLSDDEIEACLAHELGHIAHHDTDLILLVSVGNLAISTAVLALKAVFILINFFTVMVIGATADNETDGFVGGFVHIIYQFFLVTVAGGIMKLWTWLGTVLVMKSCRDNEYEADAFAYYCGYGDVLAYVLQHYEQSSEVDLFASLISSHPHSDSRVRALNELKNK